MIADAIKDVSRRGGVVLDLFGGSGSTLIAAHKTSRRARLCELDPIYCDRILQRWEIFAKDDAELVACGLRGREANSKSLGEQAGEGRPAYQASASDLPPAIVHQPVVTLGPAGTRPRKIDPTAHEGSFGLPRPRRPGSLRG